MFAFVVIWLLNDLLVFGLDFALTLWFRVILICLGLFWFGCWCVWLVIFDWLTIDYCLLVLQAGCLTGICFGLFASWWCFGFVVNYLFCCFLLFIVVLMTGIELIVDLWLCCLFILILLVWVVWFRCCGGFGCLFGFAGGCGSCISCLCTDCLRLELCSCYAWWFLFGCLLIILEFWTLISWLLLRCVPFYMIL